MIFCIQNATIEIKRSGEIVLYIYEITSEHDGITVNSFLRRVKRYSGSVINALKKSPTGIMRDGRVVWTPEILHTSDRLCVTLPEEENVTIPLEKDVPVAYEDDNYIIYNKPSEMPVHESRGHIGDTLANVFACDMKKRGIKTLFRPINRLDRNTTGLVICAKNEYSASLLRGEKIDKIYYAAVRGRVAPESGTINLPIFCPVSNGLYRAVALTPEEIAKSKNAVTHYETVTYLDGVTLLRLHLETGRTHQIRVHLSYMGYPIIGDEMYNKMYNDENIHYDSQLLHCGEIKFYSFINDKTISVNADPPKTMCELCNIRLPTL